MGGPAGPLVNCFCLLLSGIFATSLLAVWVSIFSFCYFQRTLISPHNKFSGLV